LNAEKANMASELEAVEVASQAAAAAQHNDEA
jgi:hypothetical protein